MAKLRIRTIVLIATLFAGSLTGDLSAATPQPPQVTLTETAVIAANVSKGESAVLFGAAQEFNGTGVQLRRWYRVATDDDRDGRVEFDLSIAIPIQSMWFVADSATGAIGSAAPPESRFRQLEFPAAVLRKNKDGDVEQFVSGRGMIDLLVIRPRAGVWSASAADGHDSDADGKHDGRTSIAFSRSHSLVGRVPAPRHLTPRDVVVAVDVRRLQYYLTEVKQ
jgi:hypothetical protein